MAEERDYVLMKANLGWATIRAKFWKRELVHLHIDRTDIPTPEQWAAVNPLPYSLKAFCNKFPKAVQSKHSEREAKLAAFCAAYLARHGHRYEPGPYDLRVISRVEVSDRLLHVYFNTPFWFTKNGHSVQAYADNWNEVAATTAGTTDAQKPKAHTHPDTWNVAYNASLTEPKRMEYHAHLMALGWRKAHHPTAGTVFHLPTSS